MAKKGQHVADNENKNPTGTNDTGDTTQTTKGKKQKKTYN